MPERDEDADFEELALTADLTPTDALLTACDALAADDMILWLRRGQYLITEATTSRDAAQFPSVDIPVGEGIAGKVFRSRRPLIITDLSDPAELTTIGMTPKQPAAVKAMGWKGAAFVPLPYPPDTAMVAIYSGTAGFFSSEDVPAIILAGERAVLRSKWERVAARVIRLAHVPDNIDVHIHDMAQYADSALMEVQGLRDRKPSADAGRAAVNLANLTRQADRSLKAVATKSAKRRVVDVSRLAHSAAEAVRTRCDEETIDLRLRIEDRCAAMTNDDYMHRAIINLLTNAIEQLVDMSHRKQKRITLGVRAEAGLVVISVRDNGPGVAPERIGKIFDPGVTYSNRGHGLGLSQVEATAVFSGGFVDLDTEFGHGSTFSISIPKYKRGR